MTTKVVFVDCFDTIVLRRVPAEKVKYLWAHEMNKIYSQIYCDDFYRAFLSAEKKARHKNHLTYGVAECCLEDIAEIIYNRIETYELLKCGINKQQFLDNVIDCYVKIEKQVLYPNEKMINKLKDLKANGCKIFVVSDFYCSSKILKELFKHLHIDDMFDEVYVSCDVNKTKEKGTLYIHALEENKLKAEDVVMFGDNEHSDKKMAESLGIKSTKLKSYNNQFKLIERLEKVKLPKQYNDIFKATQTNNFSNSSFALFVFTKRLVENLQKEKIKNVFFLSREGEFLKKIFDFYVKKFNISDITSRYLQVSRNSILVAGLKDLEVEKFETVINETGRISVEKFLKTLSFPFELIETICSKLTVDTAKEVVNFLESGEFIQLKQNNDFVQYYNLSREKQNKAFTKYVNSFDVDFIQEGLTVVDVGWKGTMQDLLIKFFNDDVKITGYYLGYNGLGKEGKQNKKVGLLYSEAPFECDLENRIYKLDSLYFEQLLRASTNRVSGYKVVADSVEILYDNTIDDVGFYKNVIKTFQDDLFNKFTAICGVYNNSKDVNIEQICLLMHAKMLKKIDKKAYQFITACLNSHYDSFSRVGYVKADKVTLKNLVLYVLRKIKLKLKFLLKRM